jgi:AraC-like DNA-binding protein
VRYLEWHPPADLAPYVHRFWELEGAGTALAEPIFPDGRVEIVVHLAERPAPLGGTTPQPDVLVAGQMTAALRLQPVPRVHAVGVRFTPAGARAWVAAPLHELTDRVHAVDDLSAVSAERLRAAVHDCRTPHQRIRRLQAVLRQTLRPSLRPSPAIEHAVRMTLDRGGRVTVDALAHACGLSPRQLERRYLDAIGLPPKTLARTVRFQRALRHLQRGAAAAEVAATCGFADQPHLAREFRRFAGAAARDVNLAHVAFLQDSPALAAAD